jgi:hypothetical protein
VPADVAVAVAVDAAVLVVVEPGAVAEPAVKAADRVAAVRAAKAVSAAAVGVTGRVVTAMADAATVEASSLRT